MSRDTDGWEPLIPIEVPETLQEVMSERHWGSSAHPFTVFGRCNHTACGDEAAHYLMHQRQGTGELRIGSRCEECLPMINCREEWTWIISKDEAIMFLIQTS